MRSCSPRRNVEHSTKTARLRATRRPWEQTRPRHRSSAASLRLSENQPSARRGPDVEHQVASAAQRSTRSATQPEHPRHHGSVPIFHYEPARVPVADLMATLHSTDNGSQYHEGGATPWNGWNPMRMTKTAVRRLHRCNHRGGLSWMLTHFEPGLVDGATGRGDKIVIVAAENEYAGRRVTDRRGLCQCRCHSEQPQHGSTHVRGGPRVAEK